MSSSSCNSNSNQDAPNQTRSSSVPPTALSRVFMTRSISVDTRSAPSAVSGATVADANRGRSLIRNRDRFQQRRRSCSIDATTAVDIVNTDHLREQDQKFERFRSTSTGDPSREWNRRFPDGHLVIYTDGSARPAPPFSNCSGMGIYMGPNHPLNRAQRVDGPPHDPSRAELLACILALRNLREWPEYKGQPVIVRTDSLGVVYAMKGQLGGPSFYRKMLQDYQTEIEELRTEVSLVEGGVRFEHVYAHAEDPGNDAADVLAGQTTTEPRLSRSWSRNRDREFGRRRSKDNDPRHIRSHSAEVRPGRRTE